MFDPWFVFGWEHWVPYAAIDARVAHHVVNKASDAFRGNKLRQQRRAFASTGFGWQLPEDLFHRRIYDETEPSTEKSGLHAMGFQRRNKLKPFT